MLLRLTTLTLWVCLLSGVIACSNPADTAPTAGDHAMAGMQDDGATPMTGEMAGMADDMAAMEATISTLATLNGAEFEAAFLAAMISHHQSAIDMANIALERGRREEVKTLAQAIIAAQEAESEQMITWLNDWHGQAPLGDDHGMAMADATENLRTIAAEEFDLAFVNAMIQHHTTAVEMAELLAERSARPELQTLATDIITSQTAEIEQMEQWAAAWGAGASHPSPYATHLNRLQTGAARMRQYDPLRV